MGMEMNRDLVADANENLRTAFERLAAHSPEGATAQFGTVPVAATGIDVPFFNRVLVLGPPDPDELGAAVDWMADREAPFLVTVAESALDAVREHADDVGIVETDDTQPGMALPSLSDLEAGGHSDATIEPVTDQKDLNDFVRVSAMAFDMPIDVAQRTMPESVLDDDELRPFVGRIDRKAVGCGMLHHRDDVAGVYTIGVQEAFRERGIGEAITREVLRAGQEAGCRVGVLQSSEMAYSLYEGMGFETVVDYQQFVLDGPGETLD